MSAPFIIEQFGVEALAARFKSEIRAFRLEQRKQMLIAANVVKQDVIAKVESTFPASTGPHKSHGKMIGPLRRNIGVRLFNTTSDVGALIRPRARAFYGRFQETGLSTTRKGRVIGKTSRGKAIRSASKPFVLKAKPYLAPTADADADKVTEIMGDAYGVFFTGGA